MPVTIKSTTKDGTQVEITISKTDGDKGAINVKKWKSGKNPSTDEPDSDETTKLEELQAKADGTKVAGKTTYLAMRVTVTFVVNCPEPTEDPAEVGKKPTVTVGVRGTLFGAGDSDTIYEISEEDQTALLEFLSTAGFPPLAALRKTGGALAGLIDAPNVLSPSSLDRIALALEDVAASIRTGGEEWLEGEGMLSFLGFDPGVRVDAALASAENDPELVVTARLKTSALTDPRLRFKNAFLRPSRIEVVDELGDLIRSGLPPIPGS